MEQQTAYNAPSENGKYGVYGGRFVPETLMSALYELEETYYTARSDEKFNDE